MSIVWLKCECECRMKSARVMWASTAASSPARSSSGPKTRRVSPGSDGVVYVPNCPVMRSRERYGSSRITRSPAVISHPAAPRCLRVIAVRSFMSSRRRLWREREVGDRGGSDDVECPRRGHHGEEQRSALRKILRQRAAEDALDRDVEPLGNLGVPDQRL